MRLLATLTCNRGGGTSCTWASNRRINARDTIRDLLLHSHRTREVRESDEDPRPRRLTSRERPLLPGLYAINSGAADIPRAIAILLGADAYTVEGPADSRLDFVARLLSSGVRPPPSSDPLSGPILLVGW